MRYLTLGGFCALVVVLAAGTAARAGMIPVSVTVTPDGDKFRWTYGVIVTTDVNVNAGDSFTIYDVAGLNPGTVMMPDGWSVTESAMTPPLAGVHPNDNPAITDLTFTFNGSSPIVGQAGLGNFSAISDFSDGTTSEFTSRVHRQVDGRVETAITTTDSPGVPDPELPGPISETPEPATLALAVFGLPLALLTRFRRR